MKKSLVIVIGSLSLLVSQAAVQAKPVFVDFDYSYSYDYSYNFDYDDYTYHHHANAYTYDDDAVEFPEKVIVNSACQQPQSPKIYNAELDTLGHENIFIEESNIIIDNRFETRCSELQNNGFSFE